MSDLLEARTRNLQVRFEKRRNCTKLPSERPLAESGLQDRFASFSRQTANPSLGDLHTACDSITRSCAASICTTGCEQSATWTAWRTGRRNGPVLMVCSWWCSPNGYILDGMVLTVYSWRPNGSVTELNESTTFWSKSLNPFQREQRFVSSEMINWLVWLFKNQLDFRQNSFAWLDW